LPGATKTRIEHGLTVLAASIGFVVALAFPVAYYTFARTNLEATLATEMEINARLVSVQISANPELWKYQTERLLIPLARRPSDRTPEIRRLLDLDGELVAESVDVLDDPIISVFAPVFDSGRPVGRLEIARSLRPIVIGTAGALVFGLILAGAVYAVMRALPLRALNLAMERLASEQQTALRLESERATAEAASLAKSRFLTTMSHELRTPLNGILGMAQLLLWDDEVEDEQRKAYAQVILDSGNTLLAQLSDILDLSTIEAGKMNLVVSEFDPGVLVKETIESFTVSAEKKGLAIEAIWRGPPGRLYQGDAIRLRQMLSNLVNNAIKFTSKGFVRVEATEVASAGRSATLEFSVTDSGIGIPREKQGVVFEPFAQADDSSTREYGGAGLGLSIVKGFAHLMSGTVGLESDMGMGSRFWFRIQVSAPDGQPSVA